MPWILVVIVVNAVPRTLAIEFEPTTIAARTVARTRAYSSRSCPDSSRYKLLNKSLKFINAKNWRRAARLGARPAPQVLADQGLDFGVESGYPGGDATCQAL